MPKIEIVTTQELPAYESNGASGMDVRAVKGCLIDAGDRALIPTGIKVAIPQGYEIQVRSRSGLALKSGLVVLNSPGTIDADYRGEIGVILFNTTPEPFQVKAGDRIAQIVLQRVERIEWSRVDVLDATVRGEGGFGSTGVK